MAVPNLFLLLVLALIPYQSMAQSAQAGQLAYVMCRDRKVVRTIRVTVAGDVCTTVYTKLGVDKVVSSGKNKNSCIGVMQNIKSNLEKADWKCKDISAASVSDGGSATPDGN